MKVRITSWEEGMQKITFTKLQMYYFNLSLKEAKENVDKLLENQVVEILVDSNDKAKEFITKSKSIGIIGDVVK